MGNGRYPYGSKFLSFLLCPHTGMVKNTSVRAFSLLFGVAKAIYHRRPAERAPLAEFRQIPVRVKVPVFFAVPAYGNGEEYIGSREE